MTDANRRLAMLWGDDDLIRNPIGSTYPADKQIQTTVAEQVADENSLYNYYCDLIAIRHKHPAIARGIYTSLKTSEKNFGGFRIEYEGEVIGLFHNTSAEEISYDLSKFEGCNFSEICDYIGMAGATLEGTVLTVGPQTSVIMK